MAAVSSDPRDGPVGRVDDFPVVRPTPRPAWCLTSSRTRSSVFDRSDTLQIWSTRKIQAAWSEALCQNPRLPDSVSKVRLGPYTAADDAVG
jgi:hypothetical protein